MSTFTITLENGDHLEVRISSYERDMRHDLKKIIKKYSKVTAREARSRAPIGPTGNLRRSIRAKDVSQLIGAEDGLAKTVVARKPKGPHRHLVELGTGPRYTRSGAYRGVMPARPFMEPAERAVAPAFSREIRARILKKVEI